jgi:hypothetical protein
MLFSLGGEPGRCHFPVSNLCAVQFRCITQALLPAPKKSFLHAIDPWIQMGAEGIFRVMNGVKNRASRTVVSPP